jgi:hypothetical protein
MLSGQSLFSFLEEAAIAGSSTPENAEVDGNQKSSSSQPSNYADPFASFPTESPDTQNDDEDDESSSTQPATQSALTSNYADPFASFQIEEPPPAPPQQQKQLQQPRMIYPQQNLLQKANRPEQLSQRRLRSEAILHQKQQSSDYLTTVRGLASLMSLSPSSRDTEEFTRELNSKLISLPAQAASPDMATEAALFTTASSSVLALIAYYKRKWSAPSSSETDTSRILSNRQYTKPENGVESVSLYLGPTNSGKTYEAIEFLIERGHGTFAGPLRLLAIEVYEKLCKRLGKDKVGLVTGEEQINEHADVRKHFHSSSYLSYLSHTFMLLLFFSLFSFL